MTTPTTTAPRKGLPMSAWPTSPIIRVIKGTEYGCEISNTLAIRKSNGDYLLIDGPRTCRMIVHSMDCDSIDEWEEITFIPTGALKRLQDASRGIDGIESLKSPLLEVLSYLTADKLNPIARAGKAAEEYDSGETLDVKCYMNSLLRVAGEDDSYPSLSALLAVVGSSIEYLRHVGFMDPWGEVFIEAADVTLTSDPYSSFTLFAKQIGRFLASRESDTAALVGAVALAWAAQIIENGDNS